MKSRGALETIKNIGLHHLAYYDEDGYDDDSTNSYVEYDGTIKENYPDEIEVIEKDLAELEERRQIDEEILTMDIRHLVKAADLTNVIRDLVILGIFKEKMINFARLKYAVYERKGLKFYNKFAMNDKLTKEEYRLIREWLIK